MHLLAAAGDVERVPVRSHVFVTVRIRQASRRSPLRDFLATDDFGLGCPRPKCVTGLTQGRYSSVAFVAVDHVSDRPFRSFPEATRVRSQDFSPCGAPTCGRASRSRMRPMRTMERNIT